MRIWYYIGAVFFLFLLSCRKKQYPGSVQLNDPIFYFNAQVNGADLSIQAGKNNYYMYSSHQQDVNGVYGMTADLRQMNCNVCTNRLQIKINDNKISLVGAPLQVDSALKLNTYSYSTGTAWQVQFASSFNKPAQSYLWNFGDGNTSSQANPIHVYTNSGKFNVSLQITSNGFCQSSNACVENINSNVCRVFASATFSGNTGSFASAVTGTALSYHWDFGDGATSALANPSHNYAISGAYPVKLRVIDVTGDTAYATYNAITGNDFSSCATNYSISSVSPVTPLDLSKVGITWTDITGKVYSSNGSQPGSSYFQVLSVEDYDNNEKGERTKKCHVRFQCKLYNGNNSITISNADAVICVSYQ